MRRTVGAERATLLARLALCCGTLALGAIALELVTFRDPPPSLRPLAQLLAVAGVGSGLLAQRWSPGPDRRDLLGTLAVWPSIAALVLACGLLPLMTAGRRSPVSRAATDAKTAVTQALVYAQDTGVYPTSLKVLRDSGYANVLEPDPWSAPYVLSPILTEGRRPRPDDHLCVYSKGRCGTGDYDWRKAGGGHRQVRGRGVFVPLRELHRRMTRSLGWPSISDTPQECLAKWRVAW